ncbi:MAG: hypothetical protein H0T73_14475 [Ardenticatenales bacterium]|nr:hypothetical protein [Ardenticatenales bacterium]
MSDIYQFDPIDPQLTALTQQLTPGQRVRRLLGARAIVAGLIRGRLRREYPDLSAREINLKVLEELEYAPPPPR